MARRWMNYDFVECKTWGHAWEEYEGMDVRITDYRRARSWDWITLRCVRCATLRTEFVDESGVRVGTPSYKYAAGYRDATTSEKPTRNELRLVIIKRRR
jgi:hypothetical protein